MCENNHTAGEQVQNVGFDDEIMELAVKNASRLMNLELYMKSLLSAVPIALLATDRNGCIRTANTRALDIWGCSEEDIMGLSLAQLFKSNLEVMEKVDRSFHDGNTSYLKSIHLKQNSREDIVANICIEPFRDEEEVIDGVLLTIEDKTNITHLRNALRKYVPESVSEEIARYPQKLRLGGEVEVLTVLFSDLVEFTTIAEQHSPREMVNVLSEYFTEMTRRVFDFGGTLKEYVGDEMMSIFGAPVTQPDHAVKACSSALAMKDRLSQLRKEWAAEGRISLRARIGINSGPMLVGNLGSEYRFSYGVLGDEVNLASRLEGLNGKYGTQILIGENTMNMVRGKFILREVDRVRVKGRQQAVSIYELIAESGTLLPGEKALRFYGEGLAAYRSKQWQKAIDSFNKVLELWQGDGPAQAMIGRCNDFMKYPPDDDWDGTFDHETK